jgi:hypothetical protein
VWKGRLEQTDGGAKTPLVLATFYLSTPCFVLFYVLLLLLRF